MGQESHARELQASRWVVQGVHLSSADGTVFLVAQPDGDLVLYNASLAQSVYGLTPAAAIWASGTYRGLAAYTLVMQEVRAVQTCMPEHPAPSKQYRALWLDEQ